MENQEKYQWRRGLALLCREADMQQRGCYASKACRRYDARRHQHHTPMPIRRTVLISLVSALCAGSAVAANQTEVRVFENDHIGKVSFVVPVEWQTYDRHHINFGTTVLSGKNSKAEQFEISFNDAERMQFKWSSEDELRQFITWQMQKYVKQSVEGNTETRVRRGKNLVVYSTLTDKNPKPGEFKLITLGVARTDDVVYLIFHMANEQEKVSRVLAAVAEAKRVEK